MKSLFYRARAVSSSPECYHESVEIIRSIFRENGFSDGIIDGVQAKVEENYRDQSSNDKNENGSDTTTVNWSFPFIADKESNLNRHIRDINKFLPETVRVRVIFTTLKTSQFFPNKDKINDELKSNIVYKYR